MSYIRSGSNPEGLYIIGTCHGRRNVIEVMVGQGWDLTNCGPDQGPMVIPERTFYALCRRWLDRYEPEKLTYRGLTIEDQHVYLDNGKPVGDGPRWCRKTMREMLAGKKSRDTIFALKLSYKGKYVFLYRVTWSYVVRNVADRDDDVDSPSMHKPRKRSKKS